MTRPIVLLGPQRHDPSVRDALDDLDASGPVVTITAGWEEREEEVEELRRHLDRETRNCDLNGRAVEVFERDPELLRGIQARHDRLRDVQEVYRLRLGHALDAVRTLMARDEDDDLVVDEIGDAIKAVQRLDNRHLERVLEIQRTFDDEFTPLARPSVSAHREQLEQLFDGAEVCCLAGGHVGVLLDRLRLFGVSELLESRALVAWSAGAMALTDRVVLFHDSPPQGPGNAEILDAGLGLASGVVVLPHARTRLRLDDASRVSLFARRFLPDECLALDPGARMTCVTSKWTFESATRKLDATGVLSEAGAA